MQTVRFYVYQNDSDLLITLTDGERREINSGGQTEEGYSRTHEEYWIEGDYVYCQSDTEARDCDGRIDEHSTSRFQIHNARKGYQPYTDMPWVRYPVWEPVDASQRDYTAEAAGY